MVTRNFKRLLTRMLQSTQDSPIVVSNLLLDIYGSPYYIVSASATGFPVAVYRTGQNSSTGSGISVGSGGTPPSETDYNLESPLSNVNVVVSNVSVGNDKYYNNTLTYNVSVTNTGTSDITVREIGYKQLINSAAYIGRNGSFEGAATHVCLLDRTVLDSPITIPPGETGIVIYRLETSPYGQRTIDGIPIVSFQRGTDEEICAMIDAAKQGKFDLQKDCGWTVGEWRTIHIDAFTGGGSTAHAAQDLDIVISSFDDYNGCGCLFQFDSVQALATAQRMNGSASVNYGASELVSTTLPALEAALPSWLKSRLTAFDILYKASLGATDISTLSNQKLGIRSVRETNGNNITPPDGSRRLRYFYNTAHQLVGFGKTDTSYGAFTTRTPYSASVYYIANGNGGSSSATGQRLMFFGCI